MNEKDRTASVPGYFMEFVANVVRQLPRPDKIDQKTAENWNKNQGALKEALDKALLPARVGDILKSGLLELEQHNFRINSSGWKKITVAGEDFLVNPEGDVWEILKGLAQGEQLFTWDAAMRETKKAGKRMPTDQEFTKILVTKSDMPNLIIVGYYRNPDGLFNSRGTNANFWSSSESGTNARYRSLHSGLSPVYRNTDDKAYGFSIRCLKD